MTELISSRSTSSEETSVTPLEHGEGGPTPSELCSIVKSIINLGPMISTVRVLLTFEELELTTLFLGFLFLWNTLQATQSPTSSICTRKTRSVKSMAKTLLQLRGAYRIIVLPGSFGGRLPSRQGNIHAYTIDLSSWKNDFFLWKPEFSLFQLLGCYQKLRFACLFQ